MHTWKERKAHWLTDSHDSSQEGSLVFAHTQEQGRRRSLAVKKISSQSVDSGNQIRLNENQAPNGIVSAFLFSLMSLIVIGICQGQWNPRVHLLPSIAHIALPCPVLWWKEPWKRGQPALEDKLYNFGQDTYPLWAFIFNLSTKRSHFPCLPPTILGRSWKTVGKEGRSKWNLERKINLSMYYHLDIFFFKSFFPGLFLCVTTLLLMIVYLQFCILLWR